MSALRDIVENATSPVLAKNACPWPMVRWSVDEWATRVPQRAMPFRRRPPTTNSNRPDWERDCRVEDMTMAQFMTAAALNHEDWCYFDYKYVHEWFTPEDQVYQQIVWDFLGFPERGAKESTVWIGSKGANTPCHQDTYGRNVIVQIHGRKQWILFPPESGGLKPTRIPYEESSIYSQLNFSSPRSLDDFNELSRCKMVILEPGDCLILPPKWWHYVENISDIAISINSWIPHVGTDIESRLEEALTRLFVAQISKNLPDEKLALILNPNEDCLPDMPLSVAILQVESTLSDFLKHSERTSSKRFKNEGSTSSSKQTNENQVDVDKLINDIPNIIKVVDAPKDDLKVFLRNGMNENKKRKISENTSNCNTIENLNLDNLTSSIIDSFCHPSIITSVKENLVNHFRY